MGFWFFMLCVDLLIPVTMAGFGKWFLSRPPRTINAVFGYRSAMSMKNEDTWKFAHRYCGTLWFRCGLALAPLSALPLLFVIGQSADRIGTVGGIVCEVQLVPFVGSFFLTEAALRKTFDKNGARREN